ncbi:unnamed protein product [Urochloa decumbens]|uniref:E2 ubiquitin-conjugating enzyme n=1 Tax=Urochloa decumbens TaxID=240449 RepID=A0ABC8ZM71_9POAL
MAESSSKGNNPAGSGDGWKSAMDDDPDVVEVTAEEAAGWSSSGRQKRKLTEVAPSDIIELDADDAADGVMIIDEKIKNHKNKQAVHMDWPEHAKLQSGTSADNFTSPNTIPVTKIGPWDVLEGYCNNVSGSSVIPITKVGPWDGLGGSHNNAVIPNAIPITKVGPWDGLGGSHNNVVIPNAIPITKVGPWDGLGGSHNNVAIPNAIPITGSHNNAAILNAIPITTVAPWNVLGSYHNNFSGPSAIPITKVGLWGGLAGYHNNVTGPGAIPVTKVGPWNGLGGYHNSITGSSVIPATNFSLPNGPMFAPYYYNHSVVAPGEKHKYDSNSTPVMESGSSFNSAANNHMEITPCVEAVLPQGTSDEMPDRPSQTEIVNSEVLEKYKTFKQFDTATDHSDHFYSLKARAVKKPSKVWVKRIQHEWKILENDLPDTIYVRVYEDRMDLLRAVIVGPAGTPYHDGLFFFDIYFPSQYPTKPPLVSYRSGGLRLNPNLYECGKVCLSLLNTWAGDACERWNPSNSTMLQVLVSIQALVLNAKPYFNEPAYAMSANTPFGKKLSMAYNEDVFLLSCRTMQYCLRNPPKQFEDFVVGHFYNYGGKILKGCKSYLDGAQVGCLDGDEVQDVDDGDKSFSTKFKASLNVLFPDLIKEFAKIGVDCDEFQNPELDLKL